MTDPYDILPYRGHAVQCTEQGEIRLVTRIIDQGEYDVSLKIEVSDTRSRLAAKKKSAIGNPGARAGDAATRRHQGTGLGMAIARLIAEAHGGWIDVADSNTGAEIQLVIPRGER